MRISTLVEIGVVVILQSRLVNLYTCTVVTKVAMEPP